MAAATAAPSAASAASSAPRCAACWCARSSTSRRSGARRRSPRRSTRRSTCWPSASASARWSAQVAGYDYIDFVGTGIVATTVLFSRRVPGDVLDVRQVRVPAHLRRDPRRAGRHRGARHRRGAVDRARAPAIYGCVPMLVAMVFGLDPSWGMLLVPLDRRARRLRLGVLRHLHRRARRSRSRASPTGRAAC